MDPLTLLLLGGSAAGTLFGGQKQPSFADIQKMFGPEALGKNANAIYQILASSPSFRNAIGGANLAGQNAGQTIDANLARAGLGSTGVGAVGEGLGSAASGFNISNLIGGLHQTALGQAGDLNQLLAQIYMNTRQQHSPFQTASAAVLGAGAPSLFKVGTPKPNLVRPAGGGGGAPWTSPDPYNSSGNWWGP